MVQLKNAETFSGVGFFSSCCCFIHTIALYFAESKIHSNGELFNICSEDEVCEPWNLICVP